MIELLESLQKFWVDLQHGQLPQLGPWNYLLLSILIVWQGPIASVLGGAISSTGLLKPWLVFLSGAVGNLAADIIWYSVGRRTTMQRLAKLRWLGLNESRLERLEQSTRKHAVRFLLIAKLSAGLAVPALIGAGMSKVRWRRWLPAVLFGETVWTGGLVLLGFYAAESLRRIQQGVQYLAVGITLATLIMFILIVPRFLRNDDPVLMKGSDDFNDSSSS